MMHNYSSLIKKSTINPNIALPKQHKKVLILSDFDSTISQVDVTDSLLADFGQTGCEQLEALWLADIIGSKECMAKQIALIDATLQQLNNHLATLVIDTDFIEFVELTKKNDIELQVVSDGLDYAIHTILARYNLTHLPIYANRLLYDGERSWQLAFPYSNDTCKKQSGNCKCAHLASQRKQADFVIYIGDGSSDYCVSHHADIVFAKSKLITYCQQNNIKHHPISGFADAIELLQKMLPTFKQNNKPRPINQLRDTQSTEAEIIL